LDFQISRTGEISEQFDREKVDLVSKKHLSHIGKYILEEVVTI